MLRFLAIGNKILQQGGTYLTLFGVATVVGIAGTSQTHLFHIAVINADNCQVSTFV